MTAQTPLPPRPLRVSALTVARDGRTLFSDLAFTVDPGGVLLVRGPNGAGKSSLLLALAGILRPEAGSIELTAGDERPGETLHFLGHLNAVKPRLTLAENLNFWMELHEVPVGSPSPLRGGDRGGGMRAGLALTPSTEDLARAPNERSDARARTIADAQPSTHARQPRPLSPPRKGEGDQGTAISAALEAVGLGGLDQSDAGHLSQGQTRRLALARLVAIRRPIWLLDEPTAALDTGGEAVVATLIRNHRASGGVAVIATHHDLDIGPAETLTLGAA